jgi:hypothetical protein
LKPGAVREVSASGGRSRRGGFARRSLET